MIKIGKFLKSLEFEVIKTIESIDIINVCIGLIISGITLWVLAMLMWILQIK